MSVADYCQDLNSGKIVVNDDYQRSDGIWSTPAKCFFIESILLEYPIPKLYLYANLDLKTRKTVKEIVDGQQRSRALQDFFNGKLRLSKSLETIDLRGKKYAELSEEWQTAFLAYSLPIDQFSGVTEEHVQEAFRRMNANNVPLNDEEQRNARYQGPFKWFILELAKEYRVYFASIKLFSKRDFLRMTDVKAYAEIAYVLDQGFQTVKGKEIDALYRKYNSAFPEQERFKELIDTGVKKFVERRDLHVDVFLRSHVFQSIVLAFIHQERGRLTDAAHRYAEDCKAHKFDGGFDVLARALDDPEAFPELAEFIEACSSKTNVNKPKAIRYLYLKKAAEIDP